MAGIEVLSPERVRIGSKEFRLFTSDELMPDGASSWVELTGSDRNGIPGKIALPDLHGVRAGELPSGFLISIYEPKLKTREIDNLYFKHVLGQLTVKFATSHSYQDWPFRSNLTHFCSELADAFQEAMPDCVASRTEQGEYGVSNWCTLRLPENADLYAYTTKIDRIAQRVIRDAVHAERDGAPGKDAALKPDEHGFKWWLRYVVIPLAGSAALVALIGWLG